jgi:hypothetical protein
VATEGDSSDKPARVGARPTWIALGVLAVLTALDCLVV